MFQKKVDSEDPGFCMSSASIAYRQSHFSLAKGMDQLIDQSPDP